MSKTADFDATEQKFGLNNGNNSEPKIFSESSQNRKRKRNAKFDYNFL